jgi:hypothetical protein
VGRQRSSSGDSGTLNVNTKMGDGHW